VVKDFAPSDVVEVSGCYTVMPEHSLKSTYVVFLLMLSSKLLANISVVIGTIIALYRLFRFKRLKAIHFMSGLVVSIMEMACHIFLLLVRVNA
jgi:hypothetical protein